MGPIVKEKEETAKIMKKAVSWNKVVNHLTPPNMSDEEIIELFQKANSQNTVSPFNSLF